MIAAVMLMAIMGLTFFDVVGRYLLATPVPGSYELVALGMGILVFSAIPIITLRGEHLTIGLFENAMPAAVKPALHALLDLIGLAVLGLYAWRIWAQARFLATTGEVMAATGLSVAPFAYFMSVMAALAAALMLMRIVRGRAG